MTECIRCERDKPDGEFSVDRSRESGLNRYCRECIKQMRPSKPKSEKKTADMRAYWRERYYKRKAAR